MTGDAPHGGEVHPDGNEILLAWPENLEIPKCVDTTEEAVALIKPHYDSWLAKSAE